MNILVLKQLGLCLKLPQVRTESARLSSLIKRFETVESDRSGLSRPTEPGSFEAEEARGRGKQKLSCGAALLLAVDGEGGCVGG